MQPHDTTNDIPYGYCHCGCGQKTNIATRNEYRRGHVKGEPLRFIHGHNPRLGPIADRFWANVQVLGPDDCWEWQGCTGNFGYGYIHIGGGSQSTVAHRLAYELTYGPIPEGMYCCHHCDNAPCCNPAHIFLGTPADNMADKVAKKRHKWGETHAHAKLSEAQVIEARQLYAQGVKVAHLAKKYGVSDATMREILNRETWKHLP